MNDTSFENSYKKLNGELITLLCQEHFPVKSPDCFDGYMVCTVKFATKKDSGSGYEVIFT